MRFPFMPDSPTLLRSLHAWSLTMALSLVGAPPAAAQAPAGQPAVAARSPARPVLTAMTAPRAPSIDGALDDAVWLTATHVTNFVQQRPLDGEPASEKTDLYLAYDRSNLYVAVRVHYSDAGLIRANRVDRDQIWQDDTIRVFLDPFLDQQRAYVFAVNAFGIQGDTLLSAGTGGGGGRGGGRGGGGGGGGGGRAGGGGVGGAFTPGDPSWNALFSSAGQLNDTGWTAEISIPFKSLRYPARDAGEAHRWGLQVQRVILSKNESVVWAPVSRSIQGFLRQFGELQGLRDLSTSRNLELQPTVTAVRAEERGDTGAVTSDHVEEAGLNVKYGLASNLVFDFTVNPDFSQVESDRPQIQTNQRFPLFIQEQRPFFVEGQENFNVQAPLTVLHTRTIVGPRYGAKLTGKLGRTLVGLLVADDEAAGKLDDTTAPGYGKSAKVVVGRARQVLYGDSNVGAIVTSREFGDQFSHLAGVDGVFRISPTSRLRTVAMTAAHRDDEGVKRNGGVFQLQFDRQGRNLSYSYARAVVGKDFQTDLGFVRRTDIRSNEGQVSYTFWPENWLTSWGPQARVERIHDEAGVLQNNNVSVGLNAQFAANASLDLQVQRDLERYADINFHPREVSIGGTLDMSRVISFRGQFTKGRAIRIGDNPFLGNSSEVNLTVNLRPVSRARSEITLTTSRLANPATKLEEFDVRILRALTTYQLTNRVVLRNITEYDTGDHTVGFNLLATYRVNAGTAFFVGYNDNYEERAYDTLPRGWHRANRAVFAKLQLLFRY